MDRVVVEDDGRGIDQVDMQEIGMCHCDCIISENPLGF